MASPIPVGTNTTPQDLHSLDMGHVTEMLQTQEGCEDQMDKTTWCSQKGYKPLVLRSEISMGYSQAPTHIPVSCSPGAATS